MDSGQDSRNYYRGQKAHPFFEEKAAASLAKTEDIRSYVANLIEGIESLDLYVGKSVAVQTIRTGKPADPSQPLSFAQKKLMMDEELAVWAEVDEDFDFTKEELFLTPCEITMIWSIRFSRLSVAF